MQRRIHNPDEQRTVNRWLLINMLVYSSIALMVALIPALLRSI